MLPTVHLGATGTQRGPTPTQEAAIISLFGLWTREAAVRFHHGDCIGVDKRLHQLARQCGWYIIGHPPDIATKRAFCDFDEARNPLPYLDRNGGIAVESQYMIAVPKEDEEQLRSGTWATIRRARHLKRPLVIVSRNFAEFGFVVERWPTQGLTKPPTIWS